MHELYTDDEGFIAELIKREWSIDFDIPKIYYIPNALARTNIPGSIYIYDMGRNIPKFGINYENVRRVRRLGISIQNPENRERHFAYVNEVIRILMTYRRAGPDKLNGYDYLEISAISDKQGYTNYYDTSLDISLIKEVARIPYSGFGTPCPRRPRCEPPPMMDDRPPAYNPEDSDIEDGKGLYAPNLLHDP